MRKMKKQIPTIIEAIRAMAEKLHPEDAINILENEASLVEKFERLAKLKALKKKADEEITKLQDQIFVSMRQNPPKNVRTEHGQLVKTKRSGTPRLADEYNLEVASAIGIETFIEQATFSPSKLKKVAGQKVYDEFLKNNLIMPTPASEYYTLKPIAD